MENWNGEWYFGEGETDTVVHIDRVQQDNCAKRKRALLIMHVHKEVIVRCGFFAAAGADRWSQKRSRGKTQFDLKMTDDTQMDSSTYISFMKLLYLGEYVCWSDFEGRIESALGLVGLCSQLCFKEGVKKGMEYLSALSNPVELDLVRKFLIDRSLVPLPDLADRLREAGSREGNKALAEEALHFFTSTIAEKGLKVCDMHDSFGSVSHLEQEYHVSPVEEHVAAWGLCRRPSSLAVRTELYDKWFANVGDGVSMQWLEVLERLLELNIADIALEKITNDEGIRNHFLDAMGSECDSTYRLAHRLQYQILKMFSERSVIEMTDRDYGFGFSQLATRFLMPNSLAFDFCSNTVIPTTDCSVVLNAAVGSMTLLQQAKFLVYHYLDTKCRVDLEYAFMEWCRRVTATCDYQIKKFLGCYDYEEDTRKMYELMKRGISIMMMQEQLSDEEYRIVLTLIDKAEV